MQTAGSHLDGQDLKSQDQVKVDRFGEEVSRFPACRPHARRGHRPASDAGPRAPARAAQLPARPHTGHALRLLRPSSALGEAAGVKEDGGSLRSHNTKTTRNRGIWFGKNLPRIF
jgi:hypothetical protein